MEDVFEMTSEELNANLAGLAAGKEAELPTEGVCPPSVVILLAAERAAQAAWAAWDFSSDPSGDRWYAACQEVMRRR
jgi:hypothetical protein